jgi:hopanoid biosynthesis associated protein HpnK
VISQSLVVNADDFGATSSINAAVMEAFGFGSLRSASLIVTGDAVDEAVQLARENPSLAVGLHLVVAGGRPASPPERLPHLVDHAGRLPAQPFRLGAKVSLHSAARAEMRSEIEAQFARFIGTGLPLSHVDGHLHMHLHPAILPHVVELAARHDASALRVPRDRLPPALTRFPSRAITMLCWRGVFALLGWDGRRRARERGLHVADRVYGLMGSGCMDPRYVIDLLHGPRVATAEIYFHPDTVPASSPLGPNPGDLATLLDPLVREEIRRAGGPAVFTELAGR